MRHVAPSGHAGTLAGFHVLRIRDTHDPTRISAHARRLDARIGIPNPRHSRIFRPFVTTNRCILREPPQPSRPDRRPDSIQTALIFGST
jgi:hypothetical protein